MNRRKSLGFTLAETSVVLGITGVLTATAVPALSGVYATRQVQDGAQMLTSALRLARSEAMRRDEMVTVCALQAGAAEPSCSSRNDWSAGWMVFVDRGTRGQFGADDVAVQVQALPATRLAIAGTWSKLSYQGTGVQYGLSARFDVSAPGAAPQVVCVAKPGRARVGAGLSC